MRMSVYEEAEAGYLTRTEDLIACTRSGIVLGRRYLTVILRRAALRCVVLYYAAIRIVCYYKGCLAILLILRT